MESEFKDRLAVASVFIGIVVVIVGIGFIASSPADNLWEQQNSVASYQNSIKSANESADQSARIWPFDAPGYDMKRIKQKFPWTWDTCGLRGQRNGRSAAVSRTNIQGSQPTQRGDFPYFLVMFGGNRDESSTATNGWAKVWYGAGASLISGRHGITAAHCYCHDINARRGGIDSVAAGLINVNELMEPIGRGKWRKIQTCIAHHNFRRFLHADADFALLRWNDPFQLTTDANGRIIVNTICIPLPFGQPAGGTQYFVGIGGEAAPIIRWFQTSSWYYECCGGIFPFCRWSRIRTRRRNAYQDPGVCFGDSGGPLASQLNPQEERLYQTGVSSQLSDIWPLSDPNRKGICFSSNENVFARPEFYADWIKANVNE